MTHCGSQDISQSISKIPKLELARSLPILRQTFRFLGKSDVQWEGIWPPKIVGNSPVMNEILLWQV